MRIPAYDVIDRHGMIAQTVSGSVTGDTLLAIATQVEGVQIKDVQAGMYVYSLNEETGRLEPRRINGLLDMGAQSVFKLETEDSRRQGITHI